MDFNNFVYRRAKIRQKIRKHPALRLENLRIWLSVTPAPASRQGESLYSTFLKCRQAIPCFSVFPSLNMVLTLVMFLPQKSSLRLQP